MIVKFRRFGKEFSGVLVKELEKSVIVEIEDKDCKALRVSNNLTVIAKKRIFEKGNMQGSW